MVSLDDRKSFHLARISFVALSSLPQGSGFHCGGVSVHFLIQVTRMLSVRVYEAVSILHSTVCNAIHFRLKNQISAKFLRRERTDQTGEP